MRFMDSLKMVDTVKTKGQSIHPNYICNRVIPKKANIWYINFGDKYDLQIQIVAIFKKIFENFQNGRSREIQIFDSFWL